MTTTARTAHSLTVAATTTPRTAKGPIVRVVLGSLLSGLAGAAALTLVALPGASEHVITGSALLAFAAGWAMLAVLSSRLTSQPQPWALVPAFVLVGHSTGGTYAMTYAAKYPAQVVGMVLLDSSTPDQFSLPQYPSTYAMMRRGLGVAPSLARLGIARFASELLTSGLPSPAAAQVRAFATSSRGLRNMRDEVSVLRAAFAQAGALHTLGRKPLAVLTATESLRKTTGWSAAQNRLAALSGNSSHPVISTTHAGLLEDERASGAAALALTDVLRAVRTWSPLPTH